MSFLKHCTCKCIVERPIFKILNAAACPNFNRMERTSVVETMFLLSLPLHSPGSIQLSDFYISGYLSLGPCPSPSRLVLWYLDRPAFKWYLSCKLKLLSSVDAFSNTWLFSLVSMFKVTTTWTWTISLQLGRPPLTQTHTTVLGRHFVIFGRRGLHLCCNSCAVQECWGEHTPHPWSGSCHAPTMTLLCSKLQKYITQRLWVNSAMHCSIPLYPHPPLSALDSGWVKRWVRFSAHLNTQEYTWPFSFSFSTQLFLPSSPFSISSETCSSPIKEPRLSQMRCSSPIKETKPSQMHRSLPIKEPKLSQLQRHPPNVGLGTRNRLNTLEPMGLAQQGEVSNTSYKQLY